MSLSKKVNVPEDRSTVPENVGNARRVLATLKAKRQLLFDAIGWIELQIRESYDGVETPNFNPTALIEERDAIRQMLDDCAEQIKELEAFE